MSDSTYGRDFPCKGAQLMILRMRGMCCVSELNVLGCHESCRRLWLSFRHKVAATFLSSRKWLGCGDTVEEKSLEEGERELLRRTKIDDGAGQIQTGKECSWNPWGLAKCLGSGVSSSACFTSFVSCEGPLTEWAVFWGFVRPLGFLNPSSFLGSRQPSGSEFCIYTPYLEWKRWPVLIEQLKNQDYGTWNSFICLHIIIRILGDLLPGLQWVISLHIWN